MERDREKAAVLEKCIRKQAQEIRKLKRKPARKMTRMKFVGVVFDPEKYKVGEAEINSALSDGFEVIRDFETGGGIVVELGKWEKVSEGRK